MDLQLRFFLYHDLDLCVGLSIKSPALFRSQIRHGLAVVGISRSFIQLPSVFQIIKPVSEFATTLINQRGLVTFYGFWWGTAQGSKPPKGSYTSPVPAPAPALEVLGRGCRSPWPPPFARSPVRTLVLEIPAENH